MMMKNNNSIRLCQLSDEYEAYVKACCVLCCLMRREVLVDVGLWVLVLCCVVCCVVSSRPLDVRS